MKHPPQESDIVPGRTILLVGIGVVVATIAGTLIAYGIGSATTRDIVGPGAADRASRVAPEVNAMETAPFQVEAQGLDMHRRAEEYLQSYGWVDRQREIVHVPIEVAIEIYLARRAQPRRPEPQARAPGGGTP